MLWVQVTDKWVSRARNGKLAVIMAHKAYPIAKPNLHSAKQSKHCNRRHVWWYDMWPVQGSGSWDFLGVWYL